MGWLAFQLTGNYGAEHTPFSDSNVEVNINDFIIRDNLYHNAISSMYESNKVKQWKLNNAKTVTQ